MMSDQNSTFRIKCKRVKSIRYDYVTGCLFNSYKSTFDLLLIGVGFSIGKGHYHFYSHEGDYVGKVHRSVVDGLIRFLRVEFRIEKDLYIWDRTRESQPPVTYGHGAIKLPDNYDELMEHYRLNPANIR